MRRQHRPDEVGGRIGLHAGRWIRGMRIWRVSRPHSVLGGLTPAARRALERSEGSTPEALETPHTWSHQPAGLPL